MDSEKPASNPSPQARLRPVNKQATATTEYVNPYEVAIKEALGMLRRHRVSEVAATSNDDLGSAMQTVQSLEAGNLTDTSARVPVEADRIMQSRDQLVPGALALSSSMDSDNMGSVNGSSPRIGDAYQAEIEARRKQRQERMAKYASRLAELKQDGTNSGSGVSGSGTGSSTVDKATVAAVAARSHELQKMKAANEDASNRPFHASAVTSDDVASLPSQAGSLSTIDASKKDEEVQRGMEKVLLAILERASSRGRQVQGTVQAKPSWQQGEEKKSNNEDRSDDSDENALLQAMADLLGSKATAQLDASAAKQNERGLAGGLSSDPEIDYDPVAASRSTDDDFPRADASPMMAYDFPPDGIHSASIDSAPLANAVDSFKTELADTSGGVEAVASDPSPRNDGGVATDELDALVLKFSNNSSSSLDTGRLVPLKKNSSLTRKDDSIDERVRKLLSTRSARETSSYGEGGVSTNYERTETEEFQSEETSEDESIVDSSMDEMSSSGSSSSSSASDSEASGSASSSSSSSSVSASHSSFHTDSASTYGGSTTEDADDPRNDTIDGVLGPLNKKAGGTTGVVLEPDSPKNQDGRSILESLSVAMSLVTGNNDKYSTDADDSDSVNSAAGELMRSLCAHLLPIGVNLSNRLLDKVPEWDESNPDEPGYQIVRLTESQLRLVEAEFEIMVDTIKKISQQDLQLEGGSDETFERDLQAAEEALDREEERLKAFDEALQTLPSGKQTVVEEGTAADESCEEDTGCLENFPGVKSAGKGEMGDLEYFHLPIIFKSHVTGFEPTKDLSLEAGNVVAGQYLVEGELGSAAFSTAYRCIDLNSEGSGPDGHEEVCLKVIKNTKDFFDQSLDEIKILELLRQTGKCEEKSIIEMKTFFYHREHLIIVTELLRQNLFEFGKFIIDQQEEPYFTLPRLSYVTRQILVALEFVHSLGLVHSDVKPENILLGSYSRAQVKLIDFGSSCYLTDRQSSYIQSRTYRAPEVILGLPYDGRIDVWSLGCVVAEMFTGEVTFQNDSVVSMLSRIEAICGPFPRHMIAQGRQSGRFFTKCGLLFEPVTPEANDFESESEADRPNRQFDIFQPKNTTLSARLGFESDLIEAMDSGKKLSKEQSRQATFVDFVRKLLTVDPEARLTAKEALQHPWMQFANTLTEEDIKYPSS